MSSNISYNETYLRWVDFTWIKPYWDGSYQRFFSTLHWKNTNHGWFWSDRADILEEKHQRVLMDFVVSIMAIMRAEPKCYFLKFNFNFQCITMDCNGVFHSFAIHCNTLTIALYWHFPYIDNWFPFDSRKYPLTQICAPLCPFDIPHLWIWLTWIFLKVT